MDKVKAHCFQLYTKIRQSGTLFLEALDIGLSRPMDLKKNILICGMGGSGISGDYLFKLVDKLNFSILINKGYNLPPIVNKEWDAIVVSYSGNTEETLICFNQLIKFGISPICISSGGKLKELASSLNLVFYEVPTGMQPRMAFPYLFGILYGLTGKSLDLKLPDLEIRTKLIESGTKINEKHLRNIAVKIMKHFPVILHSEAINPVALRFRCQLNENSKITSFNYTVPEFSHNGIVGLEGTMRKSIVLIILRSSREHIRTSHHLDFLATEIDGIKTIVIPKQKNQTDLEEILRLTWELDFLSVLLAEMQNIDPLKVPSIDKLKIRLKSLD